MTNPTELVAPSVEMVERLRAGRLILPSAWVNVEGIGPVQTGERRELPHPDALAAADLIEQLSAALAVILPDGWVAVPREPTEAMADAFFDAHAASGNIFASPEECWSAMIAAAPISAATSGKEGGR